MIAEDMQLQMTVKARAVTVAWLNAFLATSDDDAKPALYRTLCLEWFRDGIQFVATNGTALFRTWIPSEEGKAWPILAEVPDRTITVMDPDRFGVGFMKALARVASDDAHEFGEVTFTITPQDEEAELSLGTEFQSERLTIRAFGQRIDLRLFEGEYPDWRRVRLGIDAAERVDGMTVAKNIFGLVGKLKSVSAVDLEFYGESRHIAFTARGVDEVRGLLMPMQRKDQAAE